MKTVNSAVTVVIGGEPVAKGRPRMTRPMLCLYAGGNA